MKVSPRCSFLKSAAAFASRRSSLSLSVVLIAFLCLDIAGSGFCQAIEVPFEQMPAGLGASETLELPAVLWELPLGQKGGSLGAGIQVDPTPEDWRRMEEVGCTTCEIEHQSQKIGIAFPVEASLDLGKQSAKGLPPDGSNASGGLLTRTSDGRLVWWTKIEISSGSAMRLHFMDFFVPSGATLYWFSATGEVYAYTKKGPLNSEEFWSNTLIATTGYLAMLADKVGADEAVLGSRFHLAEVAVIKEGLFLGGGGGEKGFPPPPFCSLDASCFGPGDFAPIDFVRRAVAHFLFQTNGFTFSCSGGLLNDIDPTTLKSYFLTAFHCMPHQEAASSMECFWDFRTPSCNDGFQANASTVGFPRTLGGELLASGNNVFPSGYTLDGDFSFVRLKGVLPENRIFLGWTTVAPASGETLYKISHPAGSQQAFSTHIVEGVPAEVLPDLSPSQFLYLLKGIGQIHGGSSGSPTMNAQGIVVGCISSARYGNCFCSDFSPYCQDYRTYDGRMSHFFPYLAPWIYAPPAETQPGNDGFLTQWRLQGESGSVYSTNSGATLQAREPEHAGNPGGQSVWWRWTAPFTGIATIDTFGSDFDTLLAVYEGRGFRNLIEVASNDDDGGGFQSRVEFNAVAGTTFRIAIDGHNQQDGNIVLSWNLALPTPTPTVTSTPGPTSTPTPTPTPEGVWVDFGAMVSGDGTYMSPVNTLAEGVDRVSPGDKVFILGNSSVTSTAETPRITKALTLCAVGGPVRLGDTSMERLIPTSGSPVEVLAGPGRVGPVELLGRLAEESQTKQAYPWLFDLARRWTGTEAKEALPPKE
jgi:hypothetical protein